MECCIEPIDVCNSVQICATVERALNESVSKVEFLYRITIKNCSSTPLPNVLLKMTLNTSWKTNCTIENEAFDVEMEGCCFLQKKFLRQWNGFSRTHLFDAFTLEPGSIEIWIRFMRNHHPDEFFLPTSITLMMKPPKNFSGCNFPCGFQKCLTVDENFCF